MKKIIHIPLDERPCNYDFPYKMFNKENIKIVRPEKEDMGFKKEPGEIRKIHKFLLKESKDAYGLVISIDTLLFGGIVPSRSHFFEEKVLEERLKILEEVKTKNPNIVIYAYDLIMRTPQYNDDEEEPDYYRYSGRSIFEKGYLMHKKELGIASKDELDRLEKIIIEPRYLKDYLRRRNINTNLTLKVVDFVDKGIIDFLVIPQDDAAEFGWTAKDQIKVRTYIEKKNLQNKIYIYPGADEVSSILFARIANKIYNKQPKMYLKYPSITSGLIIPTLEDRYLDTSVKYQITAAGGVIVPSIKEADMVVFVNAPSNYMLPSSHQHVKHRGYTTQRNLVEFVEVMEYVVNTLNKPVALVDLGFDNGGDIELVKMLNKKNLLLKLASYASWNIPCNTLGTAIAFGVSYLLFGRTVEHQSFLMHRYLEDIGYCSHTRYYIRENIVAKYGYNIYFIGEQRGIIASIVKDEIEKFINNNLTTLKGKYEIIDCYMPWVRTYEIGLEVKYVERENLK